MVGLDLPGSACTGSSLVVIVLDSAIEIAAVLVLLQEGDEGGQQR